MKTEDHWNLFNLTQLDTVLEDQTVIMGYDLYTGEYVGDPIVDGFQISINVRYDAAVTFGLVKLNGLSLLPDGLPGEPGTRWTHDFWDISDYTVFGYDNGTSNSVKGYGTLDPTILHQDYEFKWTGVEELVNIGGQLVYITQTGTGSMATLYGARMYDIADHPLNPNPGSGDPFLVGIPFEVWNTTTNEQINYQFYDRQQSDPTANYFKVWNTDARMYAEILNTPYDSNHIANGEMGGADTAYYTWNNVWFLSQYITDDVIETYYHGPVSSDDKFTFTTPPAVVSVHNETILTKYHVFHNYPNPFNPATIIRFNLPQKSLVKLEVYDILGQRVAQLVNTELIAGTHEVLFDASNLASGIYFYRLQAMPIGPRLRREASRQAGDFVETKKMLLMK
jgi:hypothetical protein